MLDPGLRDAFIGRRDELASLVALLNGTSNRTRAALVTGEAGIGKTRLVNEFLGWARGNGIQVLAGHCYETQAIQPYFPVLQVMDQLRLGQSSPRSALRELAGEVPQGGALLSGPDAVVGEAQSGRNAFMRALCDTLLSTTCDGETVLCIEDVQWADEASLLLLNYLLDLQAPGLLVVCTARPDNTATAAAQQLLGRQDEKRAAIRLRGLSLPEMKELTRSCTEPGEISDQEIRELHSFTGGSPLLARELLALLREGELLHRYTLPEALRHSETPARISLVLDLRLDALAERTLKTLTIAATVGAEFSPTLLAHVLAIDEGTAEDDLALAAAGGIVDVAHSLTEQRFRFSHPLYRMRLYERLSPSERRRLHRQVAEVAAASSCLTIDEVAHHYAEGFGVRRSEQAVAYCKQAAEEAEALFAYEAAARFWRLALTCTKPESVQPRAEISSRLGWAFWAASKWSEAVEAWTAAIELLETLGDVTHIEALALALGETHRMRADDVSAERWLNRALQVPPSEASHRARALALLASIHALRRNGAAAAPLVEEASRLVAKGENDPMVLTWLANTLMASGRRSESYAVAKRGLREAQRRNMQWPTAMLAGSLVMHEIGHLRLKTARSYTAVVETAVPEGNTMAFQRLMFCRGWLLAYTGDWQALADFACEWMAKVRFAGEFQVASARMFLAHAKLAQGDLVGARADINEALPHLGQTIPIAAMALARVHLLEDDEPAARQLVRQYGVRLLRDKRATAAAGKAALGDVAADLDEPKLWATCYRVLSQEEWPLVIAHSPVSVDRVLGKLATRMKRWDAAKSHFDSAIAQLEKGGAMWELGKSYLDAAAMLSGRRRRGDLDKAAALAEQAQRILRDTPVSRRDIHDTSRNGRLRSVLTGRQLEVLALVAQGYSNPEIATALTVSPRTVERHLEETFRRMSVRSRTEAATKAIKEHLFDASTSEDALTRISHG